jgi:hypothetical protein
LAQRQPSAADRVRVAGRLHAEQRIHVELFVRRRVLEAHLGELHLELFGDQHRDRRIGTLAHLDIGHGQDDLPVGPDPDECVGCERVGLAGSGCGHAQAEHERASRRRLQELAP